MPRRAFDFYETPPHYLDALGTYLDPTGLDSVIDPCVGEGAIAKWLTDRYGSEVWTNDLDRKRNAHWHLDARDARLYQKMWFSAWITNPPFNIIDEVIHAAHASGIHTVITLARLSVLEPTQARRPLFERYGDPSMVIVLPRYSFRLNDAGRPATDSVTCAWLGWGPGVPQLTTVWTTPPPR